MTAPTPDLDFDYDTIYEDGRVDGYEAGRDEDAHALAAVTADRDDARRELAEQKRINASNLRVMTEQLELARQEIADAPHGESCVANVWTDDEQPFDARPCDCWKAGL